MYTVYGGGGEHGLIYKGKEANNLELQRTQLIPKHKAEVLRN